MKKTLLNELQEYTSGDAYPLHMPGHKRSSNPIPQPFSIDITEIDGFDNLHHAEGILLEVQQRAAALYGAEETCYLINGSTCGILAAVFASVRRGGTILMARNCHKAAYHAAMLRGLEVVYLYPDADTRRGIQHAITVKEVSKALQEHPETEAVLLTSPTYDGVVSDIQSIAEIVHQTQAILIVDEAHGAHFAMDNRFPQTALHLGADLVINSLHKTMPSLTQTALLHMQGDRVDRKNVKKYLGIFQTSSPSYVLMAGMDACVEQMLHERKELFDRFWEQLIKMRKELSDLQELHLVTGEEKEIYAWAYDPSKVLISTENSSLNGKELADILRQNYHMEVEMEAPQYITAIFTVCDTEEGYQRFTQAIQEIDQTLAEERKPASEVVDCSSQERQLSTTFPRCKTILTMQEAEEQEQEQILLTASAGRISGEFVYLYPPGIPFLVPGEQIPEDLPEQLVQLHQAGMNLYAGQRDGSFVRMSVIRK